MKKTLVFLFAAALLLTLFSGALAAEAKPGAEVTFTLSLQNTNAAYVRIKASYDAAVFDLVGYSSSSGTAGTAGIVLYDVDSPLPSGPAGTVTLRVKDGAKPGTYTVSAFLAECYDRDENNGIASASGGGTVIVPANDTPAPTEKPTAVPTAVPTEKPTEKPTAAPTVKPTEKPTPAPTATPTAKPTEKPTDTPTVKPTEKPTDAPTVKPTQKPTDAPTVKPTEKPTVAPTAAPTEKPTEKPTPAPTATPTVKPTEIAPPTPTPAPKTEDRRTNQSVCSLGIRFRDIAPQLTSRWDMFTPLDLSQEGVQTLPLLAANVSEVGSVTVSVKDGTVTVTYKLHWPVEEVNMAFALLPDLASVTEVDIASMPRYAFGQPVSIQTDLNGDTRVLLYVLGHVNYDYLDPRTPQYSTSNTVYRQLVSDLEALMD